MQGEVAESMGRPVNWIYILRYSVQFFVINILQCRVKCVVHWRGGREGSFPERTGQPLLPPFKACTVCSTVYCTL